MKKHCWHHVGQGMTDKNCRTFHMVKCCFCGGRNYTSVICKTPEQCGHGPHHPEPEIWVEVNPRSNGDDCIEREVLTCFT